MTESQEARDSKYTVTDWNFTMLEAKTGLGGTTQIHHKETSHSPLGDTANEQTLSQTHQQPGPGDPGHVQSSPLRDTAGKHTLPEFPKEIVPSAISEHQSPEWNLNHLRTISQGWHSGIAQ